MSGISEVKLTPAGTGGTLTGNAVSLPQPAKVVAVQFTVEATAPATAPASPSATPSATGGTQAIATYFYEFSAISSAGLESAASTETHSTVSTSTGSTTLSWSTVSGSASYRIYVSTTSAGYTRYYTTTTNSFTDDGAQTTAHTSVGPLTTTPTVTWKIQGSADTSNWFDMPYITDATVTESQATVTATTASAKLHWLAAAPTRFFPFLRVVTTTTVASQLTYNAAAYCTGDD